MLWKGAVAAFLHSSKHAGICSVSRFEVFFPPEEAGILATMETFSSFLIFRIPNVCQKFVNTIHPFFFFFGWQCSSPDPLPEDESWVVGW